MATRAKDPHGPGKMKRGTSPSSYQQLTDTTTPCRRSPNAPFPSCLPAQGHAPSTTPSEKRIPNYLKPTVSSAPNPSIQGRAQPHSNDAVQKPTVNRRWSLDRPTSPNSHLPRSHTWVNPTEKTIRLQSSSNIGPKTNSSLPKPHKERFLKAHGNAVKSHSVFSSNKKTAAKKQNVDATTCATAVSTKAQNSSLPDLTADAAQVVQCYQEDQESSVADVEEEREMKVNQSNNDFPSQVPVLEVDQKEDIKDDTVGSSQVRAAELEKNQKQEMKTYKPLSVLGNPNESLDGHMEEADKEDGSVEANTKDEISESLKEEIVDDDDNKEGEESATENSKDKSREKKKEVGEGSQTVCKEREGVENIGTETKTQMENTARKQHRKGKKETQAYNDVIEETACKLLEKRKNKVKALVGAFETVISLQEPED